MGNSLDKILPGLYVGGIRASSKKEILDDNNITHILSIHDRAAPVFKERQYLCIAANDNSAQDLTQFFSECNDFIHQARLNGGNVLVHCFAGISRSVTVTTAYIMTITNLSWREALKSIRGARHCANPNFGFQRQLLAFYHDSLLEEKGRLFTKFPRKLKYEDEKECRRLIQAHEDWVLHGDECPPGTPKDEDENIYPLRHNAYGIKTDVKSGTNENSTLENEANNTKEKTSSVVKTNDKEKTTENDDDEDDGAYIDMSKNSFQKPASPTTPVTSGMTSNQSIVIPSCLEQTVKDYEDKLLAHTAKVMSHEKYHPNEHLTDSQSLTKHSFNDGDNLCDDKSKCNNGPDKTGGFPDCDVLESANAESTAMENVKSKDQNQHECIVDELFSGNSRCTAVLTQPAKDGPCRSDCNSKSDMALGKCCTSQMDNQESIKMEFGSQKCEGQASVQQKNVGETGQNEPNQDMIVNELFEVNLVTR